MIIVIILFNIWREVKIFSTFFDDFIIFIVRVRRKTMTGISGKGVTTNKKNNGRENKSLNSVYLHGGHLILIF